MVLRIPFYFFAQMPRKVEKMFRNERSGKIDFIGSPVNRQIFTSIVNLSNLTIPKNDKNDRTPNIYLRTIN